MQPTYTCGASSAAYAPALRFYAAPFDPLNRRRQRNPCVLQDGNGPMHGGLVGESFHKVERVVVFRVGNRRLRRQLAVKIAEAAHLGPLAFDGHHSWGCQRRKKGVSERRSLP
jgi:hypothetical protein